MVIDPCPAPAVRFCCTQRHFPDMPGILGIPGDDTIRGAAPWVFAGAAGAADAGCGECARFLGRDEQVEIPDLHREVLEFQLLDTLQEFKDTRGEREYVKSIDPVRFLIFFVHHDAHLLPGTGP